MLSSISAAAGRLLISEPFMMDPNFKRAVILLTEYSDLGAMGYVLNHPSEYMLGDLLPDVSYSEMPVYTGGPVGEDTLHFIHRCPEKIEGGIEIAEGVFWGGDFDAVISLINSGVADPEKIRFYIGYSGWSPGQLDTEMGEKTWLTVDGARDLIFHPNAEEIWRDSLRHLGGEYEMMINFPIDPQLN